MDGPEKSQLQNGIHDEQPPHALALSDNDAHGVLHQRSRS
ncbi:hypothetical protein EVA_10699 [gut metagenome]|uniref:Uncharacterized protein n=1 Tax=gut metagenome TaxID=749906 RepID=J9CM74_9ZZZZ